MNRDEMILIVERASTRWTRSRPGESIHHQGRAAVIVDALVAAGCVPSDALTADERRGTKWDTVERMELAGLRRRLITRASRAMRQFGSGHFPRCDEAATLTVDAVMRSLREEFDLVARGVSATPEAAPDQSQGAASTYKMTDPYKRAVTPDERNEP